MGYKEYAVIAPRIYAMRSRFLTPQKLSDLAHASDLTEIQNLLKDTRYGGSELKIKTYDDLADRISAVISNDIMFLKKIAPSVAKKIIDTVIGWEEEKELLTTLARLSKEKKSSLQTKSWSPLVNEILEKINLGLITVDLSPQGIKRIIEAIPDKELRMNWMQYHKYYEDTGSLYIFEAASFIRFLDKLQTILEKLGRRDRSALKRQLCPIIDYYVLLYTYNLVNLARKQQLEDIIQRINGCNIDGDTVKKAIEYGGLPQLYEKIMDSHGIQHEKITDEYMGDVQYKIGLRKLMRHRSEQVFVSFPFTPRLLVAALQLLFIEKEDIMVILAGKITRAKPEELIKNLSIS